MTMESKPKSENINPLESITEVERKILESLTPEDKEVIRRLVSPNLSQSKGEIIGVRTKDIFSLFEQVHQVYLRVGPSEIMLKDVGQPSSIFFTINPESQYLQSERPDILTRIERCLDFEATTKHSMYHYGDIGIRQAVNRNILSLIPDQKAMFRELVEIYEKTDMIEQGLSFEDANQEARETFFHNISNRIQDGIEVIRPDYIRRDPELAILGKHLLANGVSLEETRKMLLSFANRSCVQIAFNEKLFQHEVTSEKSSTHDHDEFVAFVPSNRLELDAVAGFQTKGSFEEELLKVVLN